MTSVSHPDRTTLSPRDDEAPQRGATPTSFTRAYDDSTSIVDAASAVVA
jgi:hypothetical protein